jgi:hypothetical protein
MVKRTRIFVSLHHCLYSYVHVSPWSTTSLKTLMVAEHVKKVVEVRLPSYHNQLPHNILSQINPVYIILHSFKVYFNVILSSIYNKISLIFRLSDQNSVHLTPSTLHVPIVVKSRSLTLLECPEYVQTYKGIALPLPWPCMINDKATSFSLTRSF